MPRQTLADLGAQVQDLTEENTILRRRINRAQSSDDVDFRLMVESVLDYAIFMLDPQGIVLSWNAGAERLKGYTAEEIVGKSFAVFYPTAAIAADHPRNELRIAEKVGRYEEEGWRVRKDGTQFWANVSITALRDDDGHLQGFSKVTREGSAPGSTSVEVVGTRVPAWVHYATLVAVLAVLVTVLVR